MSDRQQEDTKTRRAVSEWLENAWKNAKVASLMAKKPNYRAFALYMTQQSMEFAAKGIGLNAGLSHSDIKKTQHNNLQLFIGFYKIVIAQTERAPFIDELLGNHVENREEFKANSQIQNLLTLTDSSGRSRHPNKEEAAAGQFYRSALMATPEEIKEMLDILSRMGDTRKHWSKVVNQVTSAPMSLNPPPDNKIIESVNQQINEQTMERVNQAKVSNVSNASNENIMEHVTRMITEQLDERQLESELEQMNWQITFTKESAKQILTSIFDMPFMYMQMLVVSSLVWPHESYPKYPANPDYIDLTYGEAVSKKELGSGHYSDTVAVIKYVKELSCLAGQITASLKKSHRSGLLYAPPDFDDRVSR